MGDNIVLAVAMFVVAGTLFAFGWQMPVGENEHVHWEIRGPIWGFAGLALIVGLMSLFSRPVDD